MKNTSTFVPFLVVASLLVQMNPVYAGQSASGEAACDPQTYAASINMQAKSWMQGVKFDGVRFRVPFNSKWKIGKQSLKRVESSVLEKGENRYSFGAAVASPLSGCEYERAYTMDVKAGTSFPISKEGVDARVELIGSNTVTILRRTGNTDCPGESAVLLKAGKVITFQKTCSVLDEAARKVIASIR